MSFGGPTGVTRIYPHCFGCPSLVHSFRWVPLSWYPFVSLEPNQEGKPKPLWAAPHMSTTYRPKTQYIHSQPLGQVAKGKFADTSTGACVGSRGKPPNGRKEKRGGETKHGQGRVCVFESIVTWFQAKPAGNKTNMFFRGYRIYNAWCFQSLHWFKGKTKGNPSCWGPHYFHA